MTLHANGYRYYLDEVDAFYQLYEDRNYLYYNLYNNRAKRGDISVTLTSPQGSTSTLLFNRPYDIVTIEGYFNWPFLSVLHWGENPNGQWTIRVYWKNPRGSARMSNISVSLYGVSGTPPAVSGSRTPTTVSEIPTAVSATPPAVSGTPTAVSGIPTAHAVSGSPTAVSNTAPGKFSIHNLFIVLAFMFALLI